MPIPRTTSPVRSIVLRPLDAEVLVRQMRGHASAWSAVEKSDLDEERLVDFFDRVRLLRQRRRQRVHARPARPGISR